LKLENLKTKIVGKRILFLEEITSTNDEARRLASLGEKEGTVVIAATQTKGKGRLGRRWISPPGGLYISIILKPYVSMQRLPLITMFTAVAIARTIRGLAKIEAEIKWPNDIVISDKKVGGILCEASKRTIIVGIGLNLNTNLGLLPSILKKQVTSIKFETGAIVDRDRVIKILLEEFDRLYRDFLHRRQNEITAEWSSLCQTLGRKVKIDTVKGGTSGIAEKIGDRGELRVRCSDGKIKKINPEDVIKVNTEDL
jgi:BirA family biotin operon repressor/biotin-[acetyl-CoA-carboxylase] ligase